MTAPKTKMSDSPNQLQKPVNEDPVFPALEVGKKLASAHEQFKKLHSSSTQARTKALEILQAVLKEIEQSGEVDAKLLNKATEYSDVFGIKGTEPKDYQNLIKEIGSWVEQTSTHYSRIGHSIQAEQQGTSAPLVPTLSLSRDILAPKSDF